MEIHQKLSESQLKSIKLQLEEVGIKVFAKIKGKEEWVGWVNTCTLTMDPIKVQIRYNEGITPLTDKQSKGFKFSLRVGRFIVHK